MEFNEDQPAEENLIKQEISSRAKYFPFFEFSRVIHDAEMPDNIPVDTLVKCTRRISSGKNWEIFFLKKNIGGLHFIFSLAEYDSKIYSVNFKTEEYDYAVIDLPEESQLELEETLQQFIEDTTSLADGIVRFRGWGSPARYTKEDVDACREAILGLPDNSLSREELLH